MALLGLVFSLTRWGSDRVERRVVARERLVQEVQADLSVALGPFPRWTFGPLELSQIAQVAANDLGQVEPRMLERFSHSFSG